MSFTAEVKEELSRVSPAGECCPKAELSALVRIEGTLHVTGPERFRLEVATETAPVARKAIKLMHEVYDLKTELTVRRSVLHKANNYLIMVPTQAKLTKALVDLGILDDSFALTFGVPQELVEAECCGVAYLRGAFLGGGFVADPSGDFHFELTTETEEVADGLIELMASFDIEAKKTVRRTLFAVYLKGAEPIVHFLALVGAHRALLRTEDVRILKEMRSDVNRIVNAETANVQKSAEASVKQLEAIRMLASTGGLDSLPTALEEMAYLRLEHPDVSLRELGELAAPPLSKSAVYHRIRRIEQLARRVEAGQAPEEG